HRGQHAHVIGGHAIHLLGLLSHAAKEVAATDYDGHLHSEAVDLCDFGRDFVHPRVVHTKSLASRQCFAGNLQQDAFVCRSSHRQQVSSGEVPFSVAGAPEDERSLPVMQHPRNRYLRNAIRRLPLRIFFAVHYSGDGTERLWKTSTNCCSAYFVSPSSGLISGKSSATCWRATTSFA